MKSSFRKLGIISVCIMLFLFGTGCFLIHIYTNLFNQTNEEKMNDEVERYQESVLTQVSSHFQMIDSVATLIGENELYEEKNFPNDLQKINQKNHFSLVGFFNTEGEGYVSSSNESKPRTLSLSQAQPTLKTVVNQALQGKQVISDAFYGSISKDKILVFAVPVYQGQKVVGAFIASDSVKTFAETLNGDRWIGYMHLVDSDGNYVVKADESAVKEDKITILEEPYLSVDQAEDVKISLKNSEKVKFEFDYDNIHYNVILEPLGINDLYIFCVNSVENTAQSIYDIARVTIIFFACIVVIFLISLCVIYRVSKKSYQQLIDVAYYDELTGLYNFKRFRMIGEELSKEEKPFSVAIFNIRQFKFINEIFDKEKADQLLCYIANILSESIREGEYVCRESADSFYMLLRDTNPKSLEKYLFQVIQHIVSINNSKESEYHLTLKCGVAIAKTGEPFQSVLTDAMFALVKAKRHHEKTIWLFDKELHKQELLDNYIERHADEALKQGEFQLYLQPKISLETNEIKGAEALTRWQRQDGEMIYPSVFIPLFESNGFCVELDFYMFEMVCKQLREWIDAGYEVFPISINQSKLTFYKANYIDRLTFILNKYQIPASLIILEILEGLAVENIDVLNEKLKRLRNIGFCISLDDFGTGYSSLNVLARLKIDEIKIDRGFLLEAAHENNPKIQFIIEEIIKISKKLSISTVIEGIETKEDADFATRVGCEKGQGYFYSRPINIQDFMTMLSKKKK